LLTETLVAARSDLFPPGSDAMVTAGRLNLRSGPGLAHEVIGSIAQGAVATTLSDVVRADDHYWYSIDAGQVGWAAGTWLALNDSAASQGLRLQVVDGPLNLRDAPLLAEAVITALPAGATLRVTQADGGTWAVGCHWAAVQVEAPHPIEGCVADGFAAPIWRASGAQDETGRSLERPARFHFILQGKQNAKGS
jgi:hypothetical protein